MRTIKTRGDFKVKAIAGTHTVLIALDCNEKARKNLMGFAFRRETLGGHDSREKWLRSQKVFKSIVPNPKKARDPSDSTKPARFSTWDHPVQSFLWGDYTAEPGTSYRFTIVPRYGRPGRLESKPALSIEVRTERESAKGHGVWFNRGAIASQTFARVFGNRGPSEDEINDPKAKVTAWLSRRLLDACLSFIDSTPEGDGLRVAAYEFTYEPVLKALKSALERGVDVRIVYHDTTKSTGKEKGENEAAIAKVGLPKTQRRRKVLFPRTKPKIPHNKFIIRLKGGTEPIQVWTGSTNFTASGFLGQTNVGHLVTDAETAQQFLRFWEALRKDPDLDGARTTVMKLTPDPPALVPPKSITQAFSPRPKAALLKWYGDRIVDAAGSVMFTAAFGVAKQLVPSLANKRDLLRFLLMEKPPTVAVKKDLSGDRNLVISYGTALGEMYDFKNGKPVKRKRIKEFDLDKWFLVEEHYRRANDGFVFFIHTKFLLIDPLSDDPLVCSGSANFSANSLLQNDENMLFIRGDTRVADIYLTEFDRIFRHFYFRDIANEIEAKGGKAKGAFLCETDQWTDSYFQPAGAFSRFKTLRREMFFADGNQTWVTSAEERDRDSK